MVSLSDISAVNLMVGWCLLACSMNPFISSMLVFHRENTSSMYPFADWQQFVLREKFTACVIPFEVIWRHSLQSICQSFFAQEFSMWFKCVHAKQVDIALDCVARSVALRPLSLARPLCDRARYHSLSFTWGWLGARLDKFLIKIFRNIATKQETNDWHNFCENESCNAPSRFYRHSNWKIIEIISSHYISQAVSRQEFPPWYRKLRTALYCKYHSSDVDNFGCLNILDRYFFLKLKICPNFFAAVVRNNVCCNVLFHTVLEIWWLFCLLCQLVIRKAWRMLLWCGDSWSDKQGDSSCDKWIG